MNVHSRRVRFAGAILFSVLAASAALAERAPRKDVRGLWVLRTSLTSPERVRTMVAEARRAGFNTLVVQVRGRGEAYYRSAIDPRATDLSSQPAAFDPLRLTLDLAHEAGLEVHAWVNVNLVSSATTLPKSPSHVLNRHPEWLMVPAALQTSLGGASPKSPSYVDRLAAWTRKESANVEGLFLSPIHPGARAYSTSIVEELVRNYAIDGLHLDYIRYPREDFDYSRASLEAFRADRLPFATAEERRRFDASGDLAAWPNALPAGWRAFREGQLTALVADIAATARQHRPRLTMSAAVLPDAAEARRRKLQPWAEWATAGLLDVVCPMAYTQDLAVFRRQMDALAATSAGMPMWVGIGAYRISAADTATHVRVARRAGAAGILIYSYDALMEAGGPRGRALGALTPVLLEDRPGSGRH